MAIPEELIKDAPSFTEFLALYEKNRLREQEDYARRQAEYEERQAKRQAEREAQEAKWRTEREEWQRQHEEWQRQYEERQKKLDEKLERISENLGDLGDSVGKLIETLVAARLWEKFPEYGLQQSFLRLPVYDDKNVAKTEIDILLVNGGWAMAVEVKRELRVGDVDHHVERMARILKYPPAELKISPKKKLLGAVAGGVVRPKARERAHEYGFFVLELAGESVLRVPEPEGFRPKEW